jgi:hypothetical protein
MSYECLSVKCIEEKKRGVEDSYFKEQDQIKIKKLREKTKQEMDAKYRDEHKNHCFRCGTPSLAEMERDNVKIDICVNENCGAIHLDPGELEGILKDQSFIKNAGKAIASVFK